MRTYSAGVSTTYVHVLRHRTYRRLFAAQVVALLGTGLLTVALSLLAFEIEPGSAGVVVATALTIKMIAYVLLAPVVTALTSRWSPRTVLVGADVLRISVAVALPLVSETWQVYGLVLVLQAASATFTPTFQAVIPTILTEESEYTRALSLSRLAYDLETVLSPVAAAGLLLVMSFHGLFVGTALGFTASAALVLGAGLRVAGVRPSSSFRSRAAAGVRMFAVRSSLRVLLVLELAAACATATVLVNTVVVVRAGLDLDASHLAVTLGAFGAGSMVVALLLPRVLDRAGALTVMLAGGAASTVALGVVTFTVSGPWWAVLVVWAVLGAATSAVLTPSGSVVNDAVSADERPAAYAAHFSLSHACYLVAYPVAGVVGDVRGVATSTVVLAIVGAGATLGAAAISRDAPSRHARATQ